jgi:hypothetical protein
MIDRSSSPSASSSSASRIVGRKSCWAIRVGTKADRMTTVTSTVYWVLSMSPWVRPNSAAMEPKVSPVAISSVV